MLTFISQALSLIPISLSRVSTTSGYFRNTENLLGFEKSSGNTYIWI